MKNIKYTIIYSLLFAISVSFSACDIERIPYNSLTDDEITQDPNTHLVALLNGAYAQLRHWSDPMHRMGEYAGDNIMIRGNSTDAFFDFISFNRNPNNGRLGQFWDSSYRGIAQASNIIDMIEEGQSAAVDNQIGEAYFIRGLLYFYMVRVFGRPYWDNPTRNLGVPIVNGTPDDMFGDLNLPDRATVHDTYLQAINDLNKAIELLTVNRGNTFASKVASQALLSRIYLFMSGTYENPNVQYAQLAIQYANEVINNSDRLLLSRGDFLRYPRFLPSANRETIFAIRRTAADYPPGDMWGSFSGMYANIGGQGWGEMFASAEYIDLLNETSRNDWNNGIIVDARAAFIEPNWAPTPSGQTVPTRVFRFIRDVYNAAGTQTGYAYLQFPYTEAGGVITVRHTVRAASAAGVTPVVTAIIDNYVLTLVDAEQGVYSIEFNRRGVNTTDSPNAIENIIAVETYTGVLDREIRVNNGHPEFYIVKSSREGNVESHMHSPVISRLGEVYLNKAEAAAKAGNLDLALTTLNIIRERSLPGESYDIATFMTNPGYFIDKERQLELAFQAERSFDVFRNGGTLTRRFPGGHNAMLDIPANDFRVTFFIPQSAINAYRATGNTLTQNPTSN
jgi:tetratricopeptide (TPR) repeat protein